MNVGPLCRRATLLLALGSSALALHAVLLPSQVNALWLSHTRSSDKTLTDEQAGEITALALGPNGRDVRLSGPIADGAASRLETLLTANPHVTRIHLTSEGGLTDEATRLGDVIARHRLVTYVPDYCVSACTLLFVRGTERLMLLGARLGFHAPFNVGSTGEPRAVDSSDQRAAYVAAGVDTAFVDAALKVTPSDIWIPEPEALIKAHVVTGVVGPDHFPDSNLDGADDEAGARETILRNFPSFLSPNTKSAAILAQAVTWYLSAYDRGESEQTVQLGLQRYAALAQAQTKALLFAASRRSAVRIKEAAVTKVSDR